MDDAHLITLMQNEDMTNGFWNNLISQQFPFPDYLVVPEYQFPGGRADLAVIKLDNGRLVLVLEGKRAGGSFVTISRAAQQAAIAAGKIGSTPGIIAALGPKFCLYRADTSPVTTFAGADGSGISTITNVNIQKITTKLQQCRAWNGSGGW
ncbi:hypothetical protein E4T42_08725 [Aureobasidium subglaciale]|nr:hypothetical protein E4T42_08725 [Aureobasidium subglaciale]